MKKIPESNQRAICILKDNNFTYDEIVEILKMPIDRTSIINIYQNYKNQKKLKVQEEAEEITSSAYYSDVSTMSDTAQVKEKSNEEESVLEVQKDKEKTLSNAYDSSDSTVTDTAQVKEKSDNKNSERLKKMIRLYQSKRDIKYEEDDIDRIAEIIKSIIPNDKFNIDKVKETFIKMTEKKLSPSDFSRLYNE